MPSVRRRDNGNYQLLAYVGYDAQKKQIVRTKTWKPPDGWSEKKAEKEAQRQAAIFEEQIKSGQISDNKMKFSEYILYWLKNYAEKNLRPKTVDDYKRMMSRINEELGHLPLCKISPQHLLTFYNTLGSSVKRNVTVVSKIDLKRQIKVKRFTQATLSDASQVSITTIATASHGKPISEKSARQLCQALNLSYDETFLQTADNTPVLTASSIQHYHRLLSSMFSLAVQWQFIPYNPCSRVTPPKNETPEALYLDADQAKLLLQLLKKESGTYRRPISLLLLTGMRRGELAGLNWSDVNFDEKYLEIKETTQYIPEYGVFTGDTKNKSSKRFIYLSDNAIKILREQFLYQQTLRKQLGQQWVDTGKVFTNSHGDLLNPDRLTNWFGDFIKKHPELPPVHIHSLRHTYATLAIANGVPLTAVAAQLGHSTVATTANIYAHAIKSAQIAAADKLGGLFADVI